MKSIFTIGILLFTLTHSYSQQTVGLFQNDSMALNGYTLISPLNSTETYLIDNCGFIVNKWENCPYKPAASVYLLDDGSIMRTCNIQDSTFSTGGSGGRLEQYDWNDNLIWSYNISDANQRQHHDIAVMPNGNVLVLAFELRTNAEALAAGRDPNLLNSVLWSEKIIELQPIGVDSATVVWEWSLWNHIVQGFDPSAPTFGSTKNPDLVDLNYPGEEGPGVDWIHANALDYNATLDQIMISTRNYHEIWVIDHSTTTVEAASHSGGNSGKGGDIIYRWGNPQTYGLGTDTDQILYGQHNTHWIPDGYKDGGKIMFYNNGFNYAPQVSRVQIIDPPVDANGNYVYQNDSIYLPNAPSWSYTTSNYSDFVSGVQRLENGNTLICDGPFGSVIELDSSNNIVWKYINPAGSNGNIITQGDQIAGTTLFRATKYAPEYAAFDGKDLTPTIPIELNPIASNCLVYFPTTTHQEWTPLEVNVIGNPISEVLKIENLENQSIQLKVIDMMGKVILEDNTNETIMIYDVQNWTKGSYFVIAIDEKNQTLYRQQIIKL